MWHPKHSPGQNSKGGRGNRREGRKVRLKGRLVLSKNVEMASHAVKVHRLERGLLVILSGTCYFREGSHLGFKTQEHGTHLLTLAASWFWTPSHVLSRGPQWFALSDLPPCSSSPLPGALRQEPLWGRDLCTGPSSSSTSCLAHTNTDPKQLPLLRGLWKNICSKDWDRGRSPSRCSPTCQI